MSTGCEFHADALADLAGGRLDPVREARLRDHLASCPSCREDLEMLTAVARAEALPPAGLEARIHDAVRQGVGVGAASAGADPASAGAGPASAIAGSVPGSESQPLRISRRRPGTRWRPWALPLAAAAALAVAWVGLLDRPGRGADDDAALAADAYAPYGAWPAGGPEVAGAPVLAELSAEDLELLLDRMDR